MSTTQIAIADDHKLVLQGINSIFNGLKKVEVTCTATNAEEIFAYLRENSTKVDIVIMDIEMHGEMDGIEAAEKLRTHYPEIKTLILSSYSEEGFIHRVLQSGAHGYILKESGYEEILEAIHTLKKGEVYLAKEIQKKLIDRVTGNTELKPILTKREMQILKLICTPFTSKEIADQLHLAVSTVNVHRRNIMDKLEVKNIKELIILALCQKYVKLKR